MHIMKHLREIWVWYTSNCKKLGIPAIGPIGIFLLASLFFILSRLNAKPCIPKEKLTKVAAIQQKEVEEEETGTPHVLSIDFCALQWELLFKTLHKHHQHN